MLKKGAIGLFFAVAGFFAWSCGDGSVDSLTDTEMMMISRFPSTINYDMLDSIVKACEKDKECWEKAKKTGEIYKGDYTTILRDSSGNIIYQEGDSTFIYDKDGKKLPVFVLSSNSASGGEEDVTTSGSTATSGSSSKRSSASGWVDDGGYTENGSGGEGKSGGNGGSSGMIIIERSSSSKKTTSCSSVDLSFLSSSSAPTISMSSVAHEESSSSKQQLSAGSESSQGGGGGNVSLKCGNTPISGKCEPKGKSNPSELYTTYKGRDVTYKYTPDAGTCTETSTIKWIAGDDGASPVSQEGGWEFTTAFSKEGTKTLTYFIMDDTRIPCEEVVVESECVGNNSYTCSIHLNSSSNNLTKANPVSYTWTLTKGGCKDILDNGITWGGSVSGNEMTVSQTFNLADTYSVSLNVKDEGKPSTGTDVLCPAAVVRNVEEKAPTCSIDDKLWVTGESIKIAPKTISGCDYDNDKCGYVLKKTSGGNIASSSSGYNGDSLSIAGESSAKTVNYTLALSNKIGNGSCTFDVEYKEPMLDTVSATYKSFGEGIYRVTIGGSEVRNGFGCTVSGSASNDIIGVFNGKNIQSGSWGNLGTKVPVTLNSSYVFILYANPPSGLKCGIGW